MGNQNKQSSILTITLVASLGGFLFGFDMAVISGVLPFLQKQFTLSAFQEGWFVSAALIGCIVGVAISGELTDRLGRKKPLFISALFFFLSALGCAFMPTLFWIIAFRFLGGVGIGLASNVVPLYISEIAPAKKRGRLVTYYQFALTFGILVAYLTNAGLVNYATNHPVAEQSTWFNFIFSAEVWRGMLGLGMVPAILFLLGLFLVPESPRWLIQQGRVEEGKAIIQRISSTSELQSNLQQLQQTGKAENVSYKELFSSRWRKALIIGILLPLFSQFSGINAIIYYGPSILSNAGVSLSNSLLSQVIFGAANMIFTLIAIWKVDSAGRRPLYLWGTAGAMAISIMVMWIADTIVGQLTPVLLKNIGTAATFWTFAAFCVIAFITVYKLLPETKGKSLEQIEAEWNGGEVPTEYSAETSSEPVTKMFH